MRYASLRQGLVGAWCPSVSGPFGYRLPDLSGYGNHGTLTNMDPPNDWVASGGKGALDFDGSNDFTEVNDKDIFSFVTMPFTISVFAKTSNSAAKPIVSKAFAQGSYEWSLHFGNNVLMYGWNGGLGANFWGAQASGSWADGKLHHVGILYDGGNPYTSFSIFVDSIKQTTTQLGTSNGPLANTTSALYFGAGLIGGEYGEYFTGQLDDIRIYNRALTEQEIRLLASERGIGLKPERQRNRYLVPALPSRNRSSRFLGFPS